MSCKEGTFDEVSKGQYFRPEGMDAGFVRHSKHLAIDYLGGAHVFALNTPVTMSWPTTITTVQYPRIAE